LIRYRAFRNSDPPAIAAIWRSQPPNRNLLQPMSPAVFDQHVLAKPFFDRQGLIVAEEDQRLVGYVHAAFGPRSDLEDIDCRIGLTNFLLVVPDVDWLAVAGELLRRSEAYLVERGAESLHAGAVAPMTPYYLGLYGGSQQRGVLRSDARLIQLYEESGYRPRDCCLVLQRNLIGFRPHIDRTQMAIRRGHLIEALFDPPTTSWWEACAIGEAERTCFFLTRKGQTAACGQAVFWDMDPLASSWGIRAAGLLQVEIDPAIRRQGHATYLLGEALRQLQAQGATLAEVQVPDSDTAALAVFRKLGFEEVDQAVVFQKDATAS